MVRRRGERVCDASRRHRVHSCLAQPSTKTPFVSSSAVDTESIRGSNRAYARVLAAVRAVQAAPSVHGLLARSWTSVQLVLADAVNVVSIATRKSARHCLRPHCSESATHRRRMYRRVRGLGAFSAMHVGRSCRLDLRLMPPHPHTAKRTAKPSPSNCTPCKTASSGTPRCTND